MKRMMAFALVLAIAAGAAFAAPKEKVMVYTSFKESMIGELRDAFLKKHPDIQFDYYSAGAGKVMAKLAAERQANNVVADVLWHSEVNDFYALKSEGMLLPYASPEAKNVNSPLVDPDNTFIAARLGTMGIAYNTDKVKTAPTSWNDLLKPEFKDNYSIANPALSGTSFVSIGHFVNTPGFGWEYLEKLKANGMRMGQGSGQVVDDVAAGDVNACLGVDYIVADKILSGAHIKFVVPKEMIVIPSPVAILKPTKNLPAAQKFVDFMLSKEAQTIIANNLTLPVRKDVAIKSEYGLIPVEDSVKRAIKVDYLKLKADKEAIIDRFNLIVRGK